MSEVGEAQDELLYSKLAKDQTELKKYMDVVRTYADELRGIQARLDTNIHLIQGAGSQTATAAKVILSNQENREKLEQAAEAVGDKVARKVTAGEAAKKVEDELDKKARGVQDAIQETTPPPKPVVAADGAAAEGSAEAQPA